MEVIVAPPPARRLAVLSGSFHPVTRAHMALAGSALCAADAVLLVMPRRFPHKSYEGATLGDRIGMLRMAAAGEPRFGVAITEGGLFREIAREVGVLGAEEILFVCGRDAAERIVAWDYGDSPPIGEQLLEFGLLVADRLGSYEPPPDLAHRIRRLPLAAGYEDVSATEVRRRIAEGEDWEGLVPVAVAARVREIYSRL